MTTTTITPATVELIRHAAVRLIEIAIDLELLADPDEITEAAERIFENASAIFEAVGGEGDDD